MSIPTLMTVLPSAFRAEKETMAASRSEDVDAQENEHKSGGGEHQPEGEEKGSADFDLDLDELASAAEKKDHGTGVVATRGEFQVEQRERSLRGRSNRWWSSPLLPGFCERTYSRSSLSRVSRESCIGCGRTHDPFRVTVQADQFGIARQ